MSTSYTVYGVKPPDERWKQMKAVWAACEEAGIEVPEEVEEFFNGEQPDEKGVVIELGDMNHQEKLHPSVEIMRLDDGGGFEVDISKLPDDVTILRFEIGC